MLTIHQPFMVKTAGRLLRFRDGFAQRIQANYEMMAARLTAADLLYLMMEKSGLYLNENRIMSAISQSYYVNHQSRKLAFINHVLNRMFVSDSVSMTYQDRVFVTHIMNQIGIKDWGQFVRAFRLMQNNLKNVWQFNALYQPGDKEVQAVLGHPKKGQAVLEHPKRAQAAEKTQKAHKTQEAQALQETQSDAYWLHQSILERLHTGQIYRELCRFFMATDRSMVQTQVSEMQLIGQAADAYNILQNTHKRQAHITPQRLTYNLQNSLGFWGMASVGDGQGSREQSTSNWTGTVLLHMLTQAYQVSLEGQERTEDRWHEIVDLISQSVQNTIDRRERFYDRILAGTSDSRKYHETLLRYRQVQLRMLRQVLGQQGGVRHADDVQNAIPLAVNYNTVSRYGHLKQEQHTEALTVHERQWQMHQDSVRNRETDFLQSSHEEQIRRQLAQIRQNNFERMERIRQIAPHPFIHHAQKIDVKKARERTLRIMENPDVVVSEKMHSQTHSHMETVLQNQELRQALGEETVRAFEEIARQQERGTPSHDTVRESIKAFDRLVHDVAAVTTMRQPAKSDAGQKTQMQMQIQTQMQTPTPQHIRTKAHTDLETTHHRKYDTSVINRRRSVPLLHRQTQTNISEEVRKILMEGSRQVSSDSVRQTEAFYKTDAVTEVVRHSQSTDSQYQDKRVEQVVTQELNRRLGALCEQVYTRLERRMESERRRRGL